MQIDVSILIAVVSLGVSAVVGITGLKCARSQDDKSDANSWIAQEEHDEIISLKEGGG